jgi:hypothetical protein
MYTKQVASAVTAGVALEIAALMGITSATGNAPNISLLAATSIFIDGTVDIIPTDDPQGEERMKDALMGWYDLSAAGGVNETGDNVFIDYPRSFGILTNGVGYDESKAEATADTIQAIRNAQADPNNQPGSPIYVVGYSQGANAASDVIKAVEELNTNSNLDDDVDLSNVTFVMLGNGARNDGGLWARLPVGVFVPFIGLSFGASTNPTDYPDAPGQVILVSKQYDAAADFPKYVLNPLALLNATMGFLTEHNGFYQDVTVMQDLDKNFNGQLDDTEIAAADPNKYIITKNGNVVDVLVVNQPGKLPLFQPLRDLGVPPELLNALEPFFRAMIETGYDRQPYPDEPVHFGLMPGPSQWLDDFKALVEGFEETEENLEELNQANLMQANQTQTLQAAAGPGPAVTPPPANAPVAPKTFWTPSWTPPSWTPPPPPPPPPVVEEDPELLLIEETAGTNSQQNVVRPSPRATPGAGLKAAIDGAVKGFTNLFTPKPAAAPSAPASTAPDPAPASDPDPGSNPDSDPGSATG